MLRLQLKTLFILPLVIFSWSTLSISSLAQTQKSTTDNTSQTKIRFIPAQTSPPPDRGTPPSKEGTGSRGDCLYKQNKPPLTKLVGSHNLKLTAKEHPTFWIYVPYSSTEANEGEFSLQDGDVEVYRTRFKLNATPGIVSVSLPSSVTPLVVGKEYRWYLDINCPSSVSSSESSTPASLTGVVQRVSESSQLQQELNAAKTPLETIATYAKYGIWLETLSELAQLRLKQPQDVQLRNAWVELLSAENVGLASIANEKIVGNVITNSLPK
ncbi:hypothetical protein SAMD00079811_68390 [Scytonema sp. HK-05]|uniref:DUF928 domain-containing protein n=1 Tax=Scytonema sp. HK-05 TaxID=1137095 RepID=UPI000935F5F1|nr:DUF928 domain-containing protein [Scytonema sp. HK-05]OKH56720.1 hypothetical protein NIES2130_23760 [Scytonema sp. HK-05]BAY49210.1 hypothetical protein SAMD00079811_68390 [Scytonema sp. HK-05]